MTLGGDRVFLLWSIQLNEITNNTITMTSLELVELINSQRKEGEGLLTHDNFMAKVPKVLGDGGVLQLKDTYTHPQNGQTYPCYRFPKREACLMAMSYSYELQAKVFDRMTELESAQNPLANLSPAEQLLYHAQRLVDNEKKIGWLSQEQQLIKQKQELMLEKQASLIERQKLMDYHQDLMSKEQNLMKRDQEIHAKQTFEMKSQVAALVNGEDFYTIVGFANINGKSVNLDQAKALGIQASRMCKAQGIKPGKAKHPIFGPINTYPREILAKVFSLNSII